MYSKQTHGDTVVLSNRCSDGWPGRSGVRASLFWEKGLFTGLASESTPGDNV